MQEFSDAGQNECKGVVGGVNWCSQWVWLIMSLPPEKFLYISYMAYIEYTSIIMRGAGNQQPT